MKTNVIITALFAAIFMASGCSSKPSHEDHIDDIRAYLVDNNIDATETESGLFYSISVLGNGPLPTEQSDVRVNYKGKLLQGNVFDEHQSQDGLRLNLQQVIEGWQEGLMKFPEGTTGILIIPPRLGYGENRVGSIPPSSVLVFDITLLRVL